MQSVLSEARVYVLLSRLYVAESNLLRHDVISTSNYFPTFRRIVVFLSSESSKPRRMFRLLEHKGTGTTTFRNVDNHSYLTTDTARVSQRARVSIAAVIDQMSHVPCSTVLAHGSPEQGNVRQYIQLTLNKLQVNFTLQLAKKVGRVLRYGSTLSSSH